MQTIQYSDFIKLYDVNFRAKKGDTDFVGQGGFGSVYKGRDVQSHVDVAIKRSSTDKKLLDEVERGRAVPTHPNIAKYIECFRIESDSDDFDVAILQYYPHGNLDELIAYQKLSNSQLDEILRGVLSGLKFIHEGFKDEKGKSIQIIHRDLKPQNILISEFKGRFTPLISDFGISKTVHQEDILSAGGGISISTDTGTIVYKAPEQIKGERIRTNLDLWAFGVMLFKILKGKLPFHSDASPLTDAFKLEVMQKITNSDLEEIFTQLNDQPQKYQDIIKRCLVRDNKQRVQTADELIDCLDGIENLIEDALNKQKEGLFLEALEVYKNIIKLRPNHKVALNGIQTIEKIVLKSDELFKKIAMELNIGNVSNAQNVVNKLKEFYPKHPKISDFEQRISYIEHHTDESKPVIPQLNKWERVFLKIFTTLAGILLLLSFLGINDGRFMFNSGYVNYYNLNSIEIENKIIGITLLILIIIGVGYGIYHLIRNFKNNKIVVVDIFAIFLILIQGSAILFLLFSIGNKTELISFYHIEDTAEYLVIPLICGSLVFLGKRYLCTTAITKIRFKEVVQVNHSFILHVFIPVCLLITYYLCMGYWATSFIILPLFILTFNRKLSIFGTYYINFHSKISQSHIKTYGLLLGIIIFSYTSTILNKSYKRYTFYGSPKAISFTESVLNNLMYPNGIQRDFEEVNEFGYGIYRVLSNDKYGVCDSDGDMLTKFIYDDVNHFSEGLAAVKKDTLWGFINEHGEEVIKPQFTGDVDIFSNGQAIVFPEGNSKSDVFFMIDRNGNKQ